MRRAPNAAGTWPYKIEMPLAEELPRTLTRSVNLTHGATVSCGGVALSGHGGANETKAVPKSI